MHLTLGVSAHNHSQSQPEWMNLFNNTSVEIFIDDSVCVFGHQYVSAFPWIESVFKNRLPIKTNWVNNSPQCILSY